MTHDPKESSGPDRPGFQSMDPWKCADRVFTRRNLPHLEVPGATYFVTFRCRSRIELPPAARDLVMAAIQGCDGSRIDLDAAVVMADHAHAIFRLIAPHRLSDVLRSIKGRTARQINRRWGNRGAVWLDETFDHIIRHEAELNEKIDYVRHNPVANGLESRHSSYRWLYVKKLTG